MKILGCSLILLAAQVDAFCFSRPSITTSTSAVFSTNRFEIDDSPRAGSDGYSVLRQPVQWDPEADPTFETPSTLKEQDRVSVADEDWLNQRGGNNGGRGMKETAQNQKVNHQDYGFAKPKSVKNMADLDLHQRTLDTLDYPLVLNALKEQCLSVPGRDFVEAASISETKDKRKDKKKRKIPADLQRAFQPLTAPSPEGLQERYSAVKEMQWLLDGQLDIMKDAYFRNRKGYKEDLGAPSFGGVDFDLKSILEIADSGKVLEGPEILEIVTMIDVFENLQLWATGLEKAELEVKFVEIPKLTDCIRVNSTLQDLLHNAFDKEGRLSGKTFPTIGELRAKVRTLKGDILDTLNTIVDAPSVSSKLALESGGPVFSEVNGRIVIPIDQQYNKASIGIIHDVSRSGKTVYVEPTEIVASTNEMRQAEAELRAEEARVWRSLTEQILQNRPELEASTAAVGQLDLTMARVALGRKLDGVIPDSGSEGVISLRNAQHPVLLLRELENVVGSDVDVGGSGNQGIVLTGPNAGGKTVILKLLGLVALMARNGIPIPAREKNADHTPRVDFFDPILADIGDLQSVGGDLSTFSGHMLVCREVLANSGENALVLMDELGSGTDPAQGVAIAQALLEAIVDNGARVGITTHYSELKQLAASDDRFSVGGMQFINGRPTYKLLPGTVGESFALAVAERLNLPDQVIQRANALMDEDTRQMGDLIRELEDQKALIDQQAMEMTQKQADMNKLEWRMKEQEAALEAKQLSARRDEAKKFAKKLEEKERVLEDILDKLKSDPSRRILAKSWDDIKFVKRDAINEAENVASVVKRKNQKKEKFESAMAELVPLAEMREKPDLNVGDALQVCKQGPLYGQEAIITKLGKKLECKVGAMIVQLKRVDVALPNANIQPKLRNAAKKGNRNSKAVDRALAEEDRGPKPTNQNAGSVVKSNLSIRTNANTVDVLGCNLEQAKVKIQEQISWSLLGNQMTFFILHGYGEKGILRTKIRNWLKTERTLVKKFGSADRSDGGDSFTKVELK